MAVSKNAAGDAGAARTNTTVVPTQGDLTITFWGRDTIGNASYFVGPNDGSSVGFVAGWGTSLHPSIKANGTAYTGSSSSGMSSNTWYFLAFVYTHGSTQWEFFRGTEGGAVASLGTASTGAWGTWWPTGASRRWFVGNGVGGFGTMNGGQRVAYPRVWTAALSSAEVEAERLCKSAAKVTSLWLELDFHEASDAGIITPAANGTITTNLTYASGSAADWTTQTDPTGLSEPAGASAVPILASTYYRMLGS